MGGCGIDNLVLVLVFYIWYGSLDGMEGGG